MNSDPPEIQTPAPQLHMVWPQELLASPPAVATPAGYRVRQFLSTDAAEYIELMRSAGFDIWDQERLERTVATVLSGGWFVVAEPTGKLVATAMAQHHPTDMHPSGGELGWVAVHPEHRGNGLGACVSALATARLISGGYRDIYLTTDHWRLPAIKIYLRLGYGPWAYNAEMKSGWEAVLGRIAAM